jgi:hypothetical protein
MAHVNRSRRKANARRRAAAAAKQQPIPIGEQLRRAADSEQLQAERYPTSPVYSETWERRLKLPRVREFFEHQSVIAAMLSIAFRRMLNAESRRGRRFPIPA